MSDNSWDEYRKLVEHEIQENGRRFDSLFKIVGDLRVDVAALKVKAAVVGGMAGLVGTGILSAIMKLWK